MLALRRLEKETRPQASGTECRVLSVCGCRFHPFRLRSAVRSPVLWPSFPIVQPCLPYGPEANLLEPTCRWSRDIGSKVVDFCFCAGSDGVSTSSSATARTSRGDSDFVRQDKQIACADASFENASMRNLVSILFCDALMGPPWTAATATSQLRMCVRRTHVCSDSEPIVPCSECALWSSSRRRACVVPLQFGLHAP